jgi:hypothetical protein
MKTFVTMRNPVENEAIRLVSGYLDRFAPLVGDKGGYTLYPNPYTLPMVCTRKFYKNKQLTGT